MCLYLAYDTFEADAIVNLVASGDVRYRDIVEDWGN